MTYKVRKLVLERSAAKSSARLLLSVIADYCDDGGNGAYPSVHTLAEKTGMSERTVQRQLRRLEQSGELIIQRQVGRTHSNVYRIDLGKGVKLSPFPSPEKASNCHLLAGGKGDKSGQEKVTNRVVKGDNVVTPVGNRTGKKQKVVVVADSVAEERTATAGGFSSGIDAAYLDELQASPAYQHLDVRRIFHKLVAHAQAENQKPPTRKRLLSWLNNERPPKRQDEDDSSPTALDLEIQENDRRYGFQTVPR